MTIATRHSQAMDIAEAAFAAKRNDDPVMASYLFSQALDIEAEIAMSFEPLLANEPTRSILHRSAAALAFHAHEYERAIQLAQSGIDGHPHVEIRKELEALRTLAESEFVARKMRE